MGISFKKNSTFLLVIGILTLLLSLAVLIGWFFDFRLLKSVLPGYPTMKFNTALGFLLIGSFYCIHVQFKFQKWANKILLFICILLFCISFSSLCEDIFNIDLGIDQLFKIDQESIDAGSSTPGRMSSATAMCFLLMSFIYFLRNKNRTLQNIAHIALLIVSISSLAATLAYILNIPIDYKLSFFTSMAIHTSLTFVVVSFAGTLIAPRTGVITLFIGKKIGNIMARRIFLRMFVTIFILTYFKTLAERNELVTPEFGTTLYAASFVIIILFLILLVAKELNTITAEREFAEKRKTKIQAFLDATPDTILILDERKRIVSVNEKGLQLFELKREQLIGAFINNVFPSKLDYSTLSNKKSKELKVNFKDKKDFYVSITANKIATEEGQYIALAIRDISKRKNAESKLKKLLSVTSKQNKRLNNFAHIVSHNLRSHSSNIEMILDFFITENPNFKDHELIKHLKTGSVNLRDTIAHLNEIVAINDTKLEDLKRVNLYNTVQKTTESISQLISVGEIEVTNTIDPTIELLGHQAYIESIILNLITNGIKYSDPKKKSFIKLTSEKRKKYIVLKVEDNGLGIDLKKNKSKLFGMYKTFHKHEDSKGIGLFITKNQIEAMGGKIEVESQVNVGSTFYVYFKSV